MVHFKCTVTYVSSDKQLPSNITKLNLSADQISDDAGNLYKYKVQGNFILLGSSGDNQNWNISDSLKEMILEDMNEFVFKEGDDFIIKLYFSNAKKK